MLAVDNWDICESYHFWYAGSEVLGTPSCICLMLELNFAMFFVSGSAENKHTVCMWERYRREGRVARNLVISVAFGAVYKYMPDV